MSKQPLYPHKTKGQMVGGKLSEDTAEHVAPKYSEFVMGKVRQRLGLESGDTSKDKSINIMSHAEVFDECLLWEGIIGYSHIIRNLVADIYGVTLQ